MKLAFGEKDGRNDDLFEGLRVTSLSRDSGASVYPTKEDLQAFEGRNDVIIHRKSLRAAEMVGDVKAMNSTKFSVEAFTLTLYLLKV